MFPDYMLWSNCQNICYIHVPSISRFLAVKINCSGFAVTISFCRGGIRCKPMATKQMRLAWNIVVIVIVVGVDSVSSLSLINNDTFSLRMAHKVVIVNIIVVVIIVVISYWCCKCYYIIVLLYAWYKLSEFILFCCPRERKAQVSSTECD